MFSFVFQAIFLSASLTANPASSVLMLSSPTNISKYLLHIWHDKQPWCSLYICFLILFLFSFPFFRSFLSLCFVLLTNKITNNISPLCLLLSKWVFWSIHNSCLQPPANLFSKCSNDLYKMYQLDYYLSRVVNVENSANQ